jgi:hypothetical protein
VSTAEKKIKEHKCYYCSEIGAYLEWLDGMAIAVCIKHLKNLSS